MQNISVNTWNSSKFIPTPQLRVKDVCNEIANSLKDNLMQLKWLAVLCQTGMVLGYPQKYLGV